MISSLPTIEFEVDSFPFVVWTSELKYVHPLNKNSTRKIKTKVRVKNLFKNNPPFA